MDKEIQQIMDKFSVGKKYAEKIFAESDGNLTQVETLQRNNQAQIFAEKHGVDIEIARKFLEKHGYNLAQALKNYEEEKYGKTILCLRKNKNKRKALDKILYLIETEYNLERDYFWVKTETMQYLPKLLHIFVRLMDWLNWESWEGILVIDEEFANAWRSLNVKWFAKLFDKQVELKEANPTYWEDESYKSFNNTFLERREELIDRLYEFVTENIKEFP